MFRSASVGFGVQADHFPKGVLEHFSVFMAERCQHMVLMVLGLGRQVIDDLAALGGDFHQRHPAVGRMRETFHQLLVHHAVEQARHGGLLGHRYPRQLSDAHAGLIHECGQNAPLAHGKPAGSDDSMELLGDQDTGLGQQGCEVVVYKWKGLGVAAHVEIIVLALRLQGVVEGKP